MDFKNAGTQTEKSHWKKAKSKKPEVATVPQPANMNFEIKKQVIHSCEFEIFGIVQDVSFRHYTLRRAQKLGVHGFCKNTPTGTVKGVIQGNPTSFEAMRIWLKYTGSPTSRIDKCVFGPIEELDQFTYANFAIHKNTNS